MNRALVKAALVNYFVDVHDHCGGYTDNQYERAIKLLDDEGRFVAEVGKYNDLSKQENITAALDELESMAAVPATMTGKQLYEKFADLHRVAGVDLDFQKWGDLSARLRPVWDGFANWTQEQK